ncbi:MAG: ABC transporter ATP-binding protein [Candidatus Saelkia tenebricola]|nr:ABC transporter ATP-binding protein [Candidatus Saelkia tenebricola]
MDNLLEIKNVFSGYNKKPVIKGISFEVAKGEFIGLIGPNGAGKSTLFKTLNGILPILKGEVYYQGADLTKMNLNERARRIAVLPQVFKVQFSYTVEEFIFLGRFPYSERFRCFSKKDETVVCKSIEMLSLQKIRNRKINELSGGELQKVLVAQAFVQEPELLLLDEPTSHLDIGGQVEIMNTLRDFNENGLTVISVLHDLNLASEYCNRLILLNNGELIKNGTPQEVMDYQLIEQVYKARVVIKENPYSNKPFLILYN